MDAHVALLVLYAVLGIGGFAAIGFWFWRRSIVAKNSSALAALLTLNQGYKQRLKYLGPIVYHWSDNVESKAKFDRYDLGKLFHAQLAGNEIYLADQVAGRLNDVKTYADYEGEHQKLQASLFGRSAHEKINPEAFCRIEQKLFAKQLLKRPQCAADVRCSVRYTSPKGQNSYSRDVKWDFDGLRSGLVAVKQIQVTQSSATFLRQQERNRMTQSLRYTVLKRDQHRCSACGATPQAHGVSLHVDHIVPVSKGGKTEIANLQTLCAACNLGKSNRL